MSLLYKGMGVISPLLRLGTRAARALKGGTRVFMKSIFGNCFTFNRHYRAGGTASFGRVKRCNILYTIRFFRTFGHRGIKDCATSPNARTIRRPTRLLRMELTNDIMGDNDSFN